MPFADVNGVRLFHTVQGDGDPLLCVVGLGSHHGAWMPQLPAFAERFRTIVFDNRDSGRSTACEGDYTVADLAEDTVALADALGLDRFHLLGISLGSAVSQHVALAHPERVATLTLAATWGGYAPAYAELRATVWERQVRELSPMEFLESMMLQTLTERTFEPQDAIDELKAAAESDPHAQSTAALVRQIRAMRHHDLRDRLSELAMPTHVIAGDRDILIPPWKSEEVAQHVDGSTLTILRGVGHAMNAERADEFNRAVLDWLGEHTFEA